MQCDEGIMMERMFASKESGLCFQLSPIMDFVFTVHWVQSNVHALYLYDNESLKSLFLSDRDRKELVLKPF